VRRAATHFLSLLAEQGERVGKDGGGDAIARITPEMANIGAAILAFKATPGDRAKAVSALGNFGRVMRYTGIFSSAVLDALERECAGAGEVVGEAKCRIARAEAARMQSMNELARSNFRTALHLLTGHEQAELEAVCLWGLAEIVRTQGDQETARDLYGLARDLSARRPMSFSWMAARAF
jgi:hypothetical protein